VLFVNPIKLQLGYFKPSGWSHSTERRLWNTEMTIVDYLMNTHFHLFLLKMSNRDNTIHICILLPFVSKTSSEDGRGEGSL